MKSNNDGPLNFECLITPWYSFREVLSIWYLSGGSVGEIHVCTSNKFSKMDMKKLKGSREINKLVPYMTFDSFLFSFVKTITKFPS